MIYKKNTKLKKLFQYLVILLNIVDIISNYSFGQIISLNAPQSIKKYFVDRTRYTIGDFELTDSTFIYLDIDSITLCKVKINSENVHINKNIPMPSSFYSVTTEVWNHTIFKNENKELEIYFFLIKPGEKKVEVISFLYNNSLELIKKSEIKSYNWPHGRRYMFLYKPLIVKREPLTVIADYNLYIFSHNNITHDIDKSYLYDYGLKKLYRVLEKNEILELSIGSKKIRYQLGKTDRAIFGLELINNKVYQFNKDSNFLTIYKSNEINQLVEYTKVNTDTYKITRNPAGIIMFDSSKNQIMLIK